MNSISDATETYLKVVKESIAAVQEREKELVERETLVAKRERAVEESTRKCESLKDEQLITFNIGGQHFMYTVEQIQRHPTSMLACFVSKRWKGSKDGIINIPRDAEMFRYINGFLHRGTIHVNPEDMKALEEEALYYALDLFPKEAEWEWHGLNGCAGRSISGDPCRRYKGSIGWDSGIHTWSIRIDSGTDIFLGIVTKDVDLSVPNDNKALLFSQQNGHVYRRCKNCGCLDTAKIALGSVIKFTLDLDSHTLRMDYDKTPFILTDIEVTTWFPYALTLTRDSKITLL